MNRFNSKEKGVALIISLIFLLMLSLIAVSSMQGTTIQEKMSGNLRDSYSAFNAAEAALLEGETQSATAYKANNLDLNTNASGNHAASFAMPSAPTWEGEYVAPITAGVGANAKELGAVLKITASSSGTTGQSDVVLESIYVVK